MNVSDKIWEEKYNSLEIVVRNSIDTIDTASIPFSIVEYRYLLVSLSIDTLFRYRYLVLSLE